MIKSLRFVELVVAIVAFITRMRDLNTELTRRVADLRRRRRIPARKAVPDPGPNPLYTAELSGAGVKPLLLPARAAPLADQLLGRKQLADILDAAISALPSNHAMMCRFLHEEDLKLSDIAAIMGIARNTARVRAHRAQRALRAFLAADQEGCTFGR